MCAWGVGGVVEDSEAQLQPLTVISFGTSLSGWPV